MVDRMSAERDLIEGLLAVCEAQRAAADKLRAASDRCAAVLVELRESLPTEEVAKCPCNMCSWLRENRGAQ